MSKKITNTKSTKPAETNEPEVDIFGGDGRMDGLVGVYLNEIGATDLLTAEEEYNLAQANVIGHLAKNCLEHDFHDMPEKLRLALQDLAAQKFPSIEITEEVLQKNMPEMLAQLVEIGEQAHEHLIKANTRLVIRIAKFYKNVINLEQTGMDFKDFIQEGNLGLMRGIDRFNPDTGYRLSTYVTWWIRQGITRALADKGRIIRIPVHTSDMISKVMKAMEKLSQTGTPATIESISALTGIPARRVREIIEAMMQNPDSLDRQIGDEEDSATLSEVVAGTEDVENTYASIELRETIASMLDQLSPQMATVLRLRYGFNGDEPMTLEETGAKMNLNREKVRRLEAQALGRLRERKSRAALREFTR
jgi:RNA polymerase sigma factor, sigma-70 family